MIDVTLIGTSALLPIPERALTAAVLFCEGHSILFDCGEGTQTAARKAGVSLMRTDIIALTHYHGDHVFGLPGLLQSMHNAERTETLYITGPEGLTTELEPILKLARHKHMSYAIVPIEIPTNGLQLSELNCGWSAATKLSAFKTEHYVPSQGYCFELRRAGKFLPERAKALGVPINQWKILQRGQSILLDGETILPSQVLGEPRRGLKFVFTGDTTACENLIDAAAGADLLICEATFAKDDQTQMAAEYGHMTFAQAATVAKRADVKELWLAHYSQRIKRPQDFLPNATKIFPNTVAGRDGMSTTLKFNSE